MTREPDPERYVSCIVVFIMVIKSLMLFVAIAGGEVLNGIFRTIVLNPRLGEHRARQIALIPGVVIFYALGLFMILWINPSSIPDCIIIGSVLLLSMALFDIAFGKLVFKFSWRRIAQDFNILHGNLLTLGLIILLTMPTIVFVLMM